VATGKVALLSGLQKYRRQLPVPGPLESHFCRHSQPSCRVRAVKASATGSPFWTYLPSTQPGDTGV
jgi:hypothetical protein